mgnify:CR=1 FL=1
MSSRFARIALLAALVLGALVPASGAAAAFAPRLLVTPVSAETAAALPAGAAAPAGTGVLVDVRAAATDDALARVVLHLPLGTQALAPRAGQAVGRATATALTATGAGVPLAGTVTGIAADATTGACATGRGVLAVDFPYNGATVRVRVVIADPPASVSTFSAATFTACVPAASKPEAAGLRITGLVLGLGAAALRTTAVPGTYRWRALVTPFAAGSADENPAAAAEAQSLLRLPQQLTASARLVVERKPVDVKVTRSVGGKPVTAVERHVLVTRFAEVRGHALEGDGAASSEVAVSGGTAPGSLRQLVQVAPAGDGSFSVRIQIDTAAPAVSFQARLAAGPRDLGGSACTPSFGAVPCVSATAPALKLASPVVTLVTGR